MISFWISVVPPKIGSVRVTGRPTGRRLRPVRGVAGFAQVGAQLAANGHSHPATPSYTGPRNT
jgi:hypothetical protein